MALDPHSVDRLVELMRAKYPGWVGFSDRLYAQDERDFKMDLVRRAIGPDGLLVESALRSDLEGRAFTSLVERFNAVASTHMLFHSAPMSGDLNALYLAQEAGEDSLQRYCAALVDLLWGPDESPHRLARYLEVIAAEGLPNKWTLPTYFLFVTHPGEDVFVKPRAMQRIADELGAPWTTKPKLTAEGYAALKDWSAELLAALKQYGAQDMIDVQSALWVAAGLLESEPGRTGQAKHWKIAPGARAWNWEACRDGGFIAVGWDELGDIGSLNEAEFTDRMHEEIARHDDWTEGAKQVWRFANDVQVGDLIVANRGKSQILGFGRVTGPYEFVPDTRHGHRRAVEWFDVEPRFLQPPELSWLSTLMPVQKEKYEAFLELPTGGPPPSLATPFSEVFADYDEALWGLGLMAEALAALGVTDNEDERFAITFAPGANRLTLDFADRCVMRLGPADTARRLQISCGATDDTFAGMPVDFRFKFESSDGPVVLRSIEPQALTPEAEAGFLRTVEAFASRFGHHRRCAQRKYHRPAIGAAVFDASLQSDLLTGGDSGVVEVLGAPFDGIFVDRAEAEWAFDLLAESFDNLGITEPDDPRICLVGTQARPCMRFDYANWLILGFETLTDDPSMGFAVLSDTPGVDGLPGGNFRTSAGDTRFALKWISRADFRERPELRQAMSTSQRDVVTFFRNLKKSGLHRHHTVLLAKAVLDAAIRQELLSLGISGYRAMRGQTEADHPLFRRAAQELLEQMASDPTKSFYEAHKAELAQSVQEPVHRLLKAVAQEVEPEVRDTLETEKRLFSVFPKNDFGKGGAWPWYWGAFYPKGEKRSQGCQLFVFLDARGLSFGFSIGNYAGDQREQFVRNAERNREALVETLADTVNVPDFEFGSENDSLSAHDSNSMSGLDLAGYVAGIDAVGPQVQALLPWDELLLTEEEDLVDEVAAAFNRLFPLVLLGTLDDPMPAISAYMEGEVQDVNAPYSLDDLAAETSLPREQLESWVRAIERKGQAILYGPPGTGKTYAAERLAKHLVAGGTGITELVQFHPAYAYEDFMQGIRPKAREGGGLDYPVVDGRFKQFCQQARGTEGLSVLIIDEVNRANLARVFGELMYLLEYRDKSIPLASGGTFSIPANVRIIGTMNTADRSIALVDHALRRRFAFLALYPDYQMLLDYHATDGGAFDPARLITVLRELNAKIGDRHYEVGTSFFMRADIEEQLPDVWRMEIEPYLEEYFFDQAGTVASYRWDEVKKRLGVE